MASPISRRFPVGILHVTAHRAMFFRKSGPPNGSSTPPAEGKSGAPLLHLVKDVAATPSAAAASDTAATGGTSGQSAAEIGMVLDALGSILATFARYTFDLPDRPAEESTAELARWQRHATLGVPLSADGAAAAGVHPRDWPGVVRTFTEHRRHEKRYVDSAVGDLRDALWSCISTVHSAVKVDVATDLTVHSQMQRAQSAIAKLQLGSIKDEVLAALSTMQTALQSKRTQQEAQFKSLADHLDELRDQLDEARRESTTDGLTGLSNRKQFDRTVERAVQLYALGRTPVTLLMIDVDELKTVNDTYGHQGGDLAIVGVAHCLSKVFLRQSDVLCRFGGDEFVAVLHNTDTKMAQSLAKRLLSMVSEMPTPADTPFKVGVSIGLAEITPQDDVTSWVLRADQALYGAKSNGRCCVVTADSETSDV